MCAHFTRLAGETVRLPLPRLPAVLDSVQVEVKGLEAERREGRAVMDKLKASLYAKFGNAINLEE